MSIKSYLTSFRGKLVSLVVCAILLPMIVSSLLIGGMLDRQLRLSFDNRLEAGLETFSLIISSKEKELIDGLSRTASDNTLQMTVGLEIVPQLRKYLDAQTKVLGFSSLIIADTQKRVVASSGKSLPKLVNEGITELITLGRDAFICHTMPIYRGDNLLGYILGAVSLKDSHFLGYLQDKLVDNYAIWTGNELIATNLGLDLSGADLESLASGNTENFPGDENHYRILSKTVDFGGQRLSYGVLLPLKEQNMEFRSMVVVIGALVVFIFLIILLLLRHFMQELIMPVTKLTKAATNIQQGKEIPYLDDKRKDEFGQMAFTFKQMLKKLKETTVSRDLLSEEVTERKKAEEALARRTEELARSNEELQQFASIASHDLQEPLRMVSSYVQLLEKKYKGKLDKDAEEFIYYAVDGAKRMQRLINDLLTYSRVGTRAKPFTKTDVGAVLKDVLMNLQKAVEDSKAEIIYGKMPEIIADEGQLTQLFQNLIANAIKFHGERATKVHVSARQEQDNWVLSVKDNGIGIEEKHKERIFQIFQRLHSRNEYEGTGIGLAVCRKIVERHGGRIWVESEPGEGTTFYFTMPASRLEKEAEGRRRENGNI